MLIAITPEVEQKWVSWCRYIQQVENLPATQPQTRFALGIGVEVQSRTQDNYIQLKRFQGNPENALIFKLFGEARAENFVI